MGYKIGIDGGGTSSRLRLIDDNGQIITEERGLSTNIYAEDEKAIENIKSLINSSLSDSSLKGEEINAICLGSAGLGMGRRNDDQRAIDAIKSILPNAKIKVTTDAHILLTGSVGKETKGIILIAGTGSIALGKNEEKVVRAGGLGWRLGDEGSAWWVAKEAIYRVYAQREKRAYIDYDSTLLLDSLLAFYPFNKIEDFVGFMNSNNTSKSDIAKGAKVVTECAKKGDKISLDILNDASAELIKLVSSLLLRLGEGEYSLVLYGGEFEHDEILKRCFLKKVEKLSRVKVMEPKGSALDGAVLEALKL